MNRLLWALQIVFGVTFVVFGVMHFVVPEGLPEMLAWMYDLPTTQHAVAGAAEIAGGLGLILPGLTGIRPGLTVWAALGLMVIMALAAIWHAGRGEWPNIGANLSTLVLLGLVAYGRWRLHPHGSR